MASTNLDPALDGYPFEGPPAERLRFALGAAVRAPSGHNTQPWLFRIEHESVDVFADRRRALPVVDPDDRELVISCGAAIHHLTICLSAAGENPSTQLFPDPENPDRLARVTLGARGAPSKPAVRWLEASRRRRTTRFAFEPTPIPCGIVHTLRDVCGHEAATFSVLSNGDASALGALIAEADREQLSQRAFRRELAAWAHPNRSRHRDGIPGYALGISDWLSELGPFVMRTFDISESQAMKDQELVAQAPLRGVVSTNEDSALSHVRAGAALSALLLEATSAGLSASFLNQAIEVSELRARVGALISNDARLYPQVVVRLGYYAGPALKAVPRRELASVLV
jgi:hypothetical protein